MNRLPFAAPCIILLLAGPVRAEEEDLDTLMMRATVKVSHDKSTGTAFILYRSDPREPQHNQFVLVTAAHVFEKIPDDEAILVFRTMESEGVYKKAHAKLMIRKDGKPLWTKHPAQDVAAMVVAPPDKADLPKLPVSLLADDKELKDFRVHPGDMLAYLGFPHRIEANEAGFPILRNGPVASFPLLPTKITKTFLLSSNTFEGDSGGPVYLADPKRRIPGKEKAEDVRLIVGLVAAQQFLDEELKMIYETTKVRHRLGLAIVVHASFIRETIERIP